MEDSIALAQALTEDAAAGADGAARRLRRFVELRGPEKAKLLGASRNSYLWYEDVGKWMRQFTLEQFVYDFMTRTGRVDDERLARQYPELAARLRTAGAIANGAAPAGTGKVAA